MDIADQHTSQFGGFNFAYNHCMSPHPKAVSNNSKSKHKVVNNELNVTSLKPKHNIKYKHVDFL